jgi:preprotein translocase subunit SecA
VIKNVYENNTQGFQQIAIPFSDGRKQLNVPVSLEKAYQSGGLEIVDALERGITLAIIDQNWKEHLRAMDDLRSNVQFASHEQKDPLLIYKFESYELFRSMVSRTNAEIANFLLTCQLPQGNAPVRNAQAPRQIEPRVQTTKADSMNLNERMAASARPAGGNGQPMPPTGPAPRPEPVKAEVKVGRNDPCPCGSGKKYKACHGQEA